MKKTFIFILLQLGIASACLAVPATPYPVRVEQPDGTIIQIRIHGDEFNSFRTSTDDYLIVKNDDDFYVYAEKDIDGNLQPTAAKVSNGMLRSSKSNAFVKRSEYLSGFKKQQTEIRQERANAPALVNDIKQKAYPTNGSPKAIIILVNFQDQSFTVPNAQQAFSNMLNKANYSEHEATGSARDYFKASSNGKFTPQFDVYGPYMLPQSMKYYGENWPTVHDDDRRPRQMIVDACNAAHDAGVNFADYDTDDDGVVDQVFVYYAGVNEAEGGPTDAIWPHRWVLGTPLRLDGRYIYDYACTSELKGNSIDSADMAGIGTFCHEFSHVLGLPDLYNTSETDDIYTPWIWDLMDYGPYLNAGRTPPTYSAYERFYAGWLTPTQLETGKGTLSLEALTTSNKAYILSKTPSNLQGKNPNPKEFFIIENRQKVGADTSMIYHGMLIWHINYSDSIWTANTVNDAPGESGKRVYLVRAGGFDEDGDFYDHVWKNDPFPGELEVHSYAPSLWNGTTLDSLTFITEGNGIIYFTLNNDPLPIYKQQAGDFRILSYNHNILIEGYLQGANIRIINTLGQTIAEGNNSSFSIPKSGIYIIQITEGNQFYSKKIFIK